MYFCQFLGSYIIIITSLSWASQSVIWVLSYHLGLSPELGVTSASNHLLHTTAKENTFYFQVIGFVLRDVDCLGLSNLDLTSLVLEYLRVSDSVENFLEENVVFVLNRSEEQYYV